MNLKLERTKRGLPALWESGGGMSNSGSSTVIGGKYGEKLKPLYVRRSGSLSNSNHALFVVRKGSIVVMCSHHRGDFSITVSQVSDLTGDGVAEVLFHYSQGEWDKDLPEYLEDIVEAAKAKAQSYHCRSVFWADQS